MFVFFAIVFVVRVLSPPAPEPVKVQTAETAPRRVQRTPSAVLDVSETYYCTIIDSNLFCLIGWTRPRPKPTYRLSGTVIPIDGNKPRLGRGQSIELFTDALKKSERKLYP